MRFFAPCPPGAEKYLYRELRELRAGGLQSGSHGVGFDADLPIAYESSLSLRTASRLLLEMGRGRAKTADELYWIAADIPWEEKFLPSVSIACRVTGVPRQHDPRFSVLRLKDAIADRFVKKCGTRPFVDKRNPDVRVEARWDGYEAVIYLNWSGPPLHERGYRLEQSDTALRETTAAAILAMAEWKEIADDGGSFVDPVCGSGTLLAEAAMIAADAAPGIHRKNWGFSYFKNHDEALWRNILTRAQIQFGNALEHLPMIMGFDIDPHAIRVSGNNLRRTGLGSLIRLQTHDVRKGRPDFWPNTRNGLICADPPYGHRDNSDPSPIYASIGELFRTMDTDWHLALLAPDRKTASSSCLKPSKYCPTVSGGMDLVLGVYDKFASKKQSIPVKREKKTTVRSKPVIDSKEAALRTALQRSIGALKKWADKSGITCYRIWDSNIPEYNIAVDCYENRWFHVQEFAAPDGIPGKTSQLRMETFLSVLKELTGCSDADIFLKTWRRGVRSSHRNKGNRIIVNENQARFFVNLTDYLDTGIFLDHRPTRELVRRTIGHGKFLNLFSYTGTFTVMAALGGAVSTVSVDVSNTYLDWCHDNLKLNRVAGDRHKLVCSDALSWLRRPLDKFDLILIDPPSYSTGAGREDWSVQRHHSEIIRLAASRLNPSGSVLFSVNLRKFVLDSSIGKDYHVVDITRETLHPDFVLQSHSHRCWKISLPKPF